MTTNTINTIPILNYTFEGPFTNPALLRNLSGVYVILDSAVIIDNRGIARYPIIDAGQSGDVKWRVTDNHPRESCWYRQSRGGLLYTALYTDENSRIVIERQIRNAFNPPCGKI